MANVCIREYGVLYPDSVVVLKQTLSIQVIPVTAWDWLLKEACGTDSHKPLVKPIKRNSHTGLQVLNYVGVITTPCGCQIEIVPKIDKFYVKSDDPKQQKEEATNCRLKLVQMLSRIGLIKFREFNNASLQLFDKPLPEVLINQFLNDVSLLIKRGIRNDYIAVRDETSFLKGRLQIASQIRQPVGRQHLFRIEHDEFLPDRAENRLIRSALMKISKQTTDHQNKRLSIELLFVFDDIPLSRNYKTDFVSWLDNDRSMIHYKPVKSWCDFILNEQSPFSLAGSHHGLSFLFPMNFLFEKYVAVVLQNQLDNDFLVKEQAASRYLIEEHLADDYCATKIFQLKPDLMIKKGDQNIAVLDCKWKVINSSNREKKYDISSGDMYQLYAYGQKYMSGKGNLYLIYPESTIFNKPLPVFEFDKNLRLYVVPFKWSHVRGNEQDYVSFENKNLYWIAKKTENKI